MHCEEVRALWADYLAGSLAEAARRAVREHVEGCDRCRVEFGGEEALWRAMEGPPLPVPTDRMRARLMVAVEQAEAARTSAVQDAAPAGEPGRVLAMRPRFRTSGPLARLAAAASLLLVGVLIGRNSVQWSAPLPPAAPPATATEIADVRAELRDMRQMLTLSLLQQQSAAERLRGVSASAQLEQPGNEVVAALLDTLLHDPNENVRLAAVDALRRFSDREDVRRGTGRAVTDSAAPLLQIAVIDFMVETRDPQAASMLQRLSQDRSVDELVRGRAALGLERLSS